jgi:ribonuclease P protein component
LSSGADFQGLFQQGKRIDRSSLIVLWRDVDSPRRVGFAVSRQLRGAVRRNRVRRRLREAYRAARAAAPARAALIIIGRPAAVKLEFSVLVAELRDALRSIPGARRSA